jgi:hypothetical protein
MTGSRYNLGLVVAGTGKANLIVGPPAVHFELIYDLSESEFQSLVDANVSLGQYRQRLAFLNLVEWNAQDYFELQERLLVEGIAPDGPPTRSPELDINRRLMNLLSSARSYLDHTETDLKRRFGSKSTQANTFGSLTSQLYDKHFSYRFLSRFRNFVQHCGLPLDSTSHSSQVGSKSFRATVSRERLLSGFDWGPLLEEVAGLPESVDLNEILAEYVHLLDLLHQRLCADEIPGLQHAATVVLLAVRRLSGRRGVPSVFTVPDSPSRPPSRLSSMESLELRQFSLHVAVAKLAFETFPPTAPKAPGV